MRGQVGRFVVTAKVRMHHWEGLLGDGECVTHDVCDYEHPYDLSKEV